MKKVKQNDIKKIEYDLVSIGKKEPEKIDLQIIPVGKSEPEESNIVIKKKKIE